jgi:hypothetical protein
LKRRVASKRFARLKSKADVTQSLKPQATVPKS